MARKKRKGQIKALRRWAKRKKTKQLIPIVQRHFPGARGVRVAVGLRAWALGITIGQLAKRKRKKRRK